MINPKELRIGNLVYCNMAKLIVKVQWPHPAQLVVDIKGPLVRCEYTHGDLEEFDPIALTPEWLERMGCEVSVYKDEDGALVTMPGLFVCQPFYQRRHSLSISHAPKARKLRYVHDLQNYYQALTGEELTIKETN